MYCLTVQECENSIAEIWQEINTNKNPFFDGVLSPTDFTSLETKNLPQMSHLGLIGNMPCCYPQAWANRQNPQIYEVSRTLLQRDDVWVNFDRFGFMRPTKRIPVPGSDELVDKPDWKTASGWIHWDLSPWTFKQSVMGFKNEGDYEFKFGDFQTGHKLTETEKDALEKEFGPPKIQGLIALQDAREEDGGFCTVPSFASEFFQWALDHTTLYDTNYKTANFVSVPKEDLMRQRLIKVPIKAGSYLVWSAKQPHANYPNDSNRFRYVQYLTSIPANAGRFNRQYPASVLPMRGFEPNELGRKLFGMDAWSRGCVLM